MSIVNQNSRKRAFRGHGRNRNKTRRASSKEQSSMKRVYGDSTNVYHPRSMIDGNPNLEMSQISQLSMDSSLRTTSQSTSFVDVPLRQPSASMESSNSNSNSSSSTGEQLRRFCYPQGGGYNPSDFPNGTEGTSIGSRKPLRKVIRNSRSSLFISPIQSLLRAKKKEKMKKTRFADIDYTRSVAGTHTMSQGSYNVSSSLSSSRSWGSHFTTQRNYRINVQQPTAMTTNENGQDLSHSGGCSPFHPTTRRQNHQHQSVEGTNTLPRGLGNRFNHCYSTLEAAQINSRYNIKKERLSRSIAFRDPIFAKSATPRKKLNIPYPPLTFQPEEQQCSQQHKEELQNGDCRIESKTTCVESRNEVEKGRCDEEKLCELPTDEGGNDGGERISNGDCDNNQICDPPKKEDYEEQTLSQSVVVTSGREVLTGHQKSSNGASDLKISSSEQSNENRRAPSVDCTDHVSQNSVNQDLQDFKIRLQEVLSEMESEANTMFQKVAQTVTCAAESKLKQEATTIQETMALELGGKASEIQEATQADLDRKVQVIQEATRSVIDQKRCDVMKAIENLHESKTTELNKFASNCVQKVEISTETGLAKISKFAETWLTDSCKMIAKRLKPFLFLSSESYTAKNRESESVSDQATDFQTGRNKPRMADVPNDGDRSKIKSSNKSVPSPKKDHVQNSFSPVEGEVSLTQGSRSGLSWNSGVDKTSGKPLRRSKRTRQRIKKGCVDMNKKDVSIANGTIPNDDKKSREHSPPTSRRAELRHMRPREEDILPSKVHTNEALCVTPITRKTPLQEKTNELAKEPASSIDKSRVECNKSNFKQSKRKMHRNKRRSPSSRPETPFDRTQESVPCEVFAFDESPLSPLEDPILPAVGMACVSKCSKPLVKKRRRTILQTYGKRKKKFDVTDNDLFKF